MSKVRGPSSDPKVQVGRVVRSLIELYPTVHCALDHRNAFELLVATVLSAQCTDERVNRVTPALFARYPDPRAMATAELSDVETLVYQTGFFRAKARNLIALSKILVEKHNATVPADLEALTSLPGVGRKTAHVVLGNAFQMASGVVVDTHVKRLAYRLGLTTRTEAELIERELNALVPKKHWIDFSHRLIAHGRSTCDALRPRCRECPLSRICPRHGLTPLES
jgi:endonuclease III